MLILTLSILTGLVLGYGIYREIRAIDESLSFDPPEKDARTGYPVGWTFVDHAAPIDTKRLRRRHIARRVLFLAVAALSAYSIYAAILEGVFA